MKKEENVQLEGTQTEEVAVAKEEGASAVLGKFKDIDALSRAYEALEAEFTRRSQKLRSLEREVENLKTGSMVSGAEKLRKTAKARREAAKAFDAFVAEVDYGATMDKPTERSAQDVEAVFLEETALGAQGKEEDEIGAEGLPKAQADQEVGLQADGATAFGGKKAVGSEELFNLVQADEAVRLRIVGEYLSSLGKGAPLTGGRAGVFAAPPKKAKTVGQAGAMALSYFQKPMV